MAANGSLLHLFVYDLEIVLDLESEGLLERLEAFLEDLLVPYDHGPS